MTPVLLDAFLAILRAWIPAFVQSRSGERAVEQAVGALLALGRRTLSRSLWALGRHDRDWSADYKLHSRACWKTQDLFLPVLQQAARLWDDSLLVVAMDDTRIRKTGRKILTAFYQRDPLSPKFRFNLMWGLRFLHFSLLVPLYRSNAEVPPRSLPVRFLEVPAIKKPGKKASAAEIEAHRQAVKEHNLSRSSVALLQELRQAADTADLRSRTILAVGDGGFCNRTLFRQPLDRIEIVARARRDCRLCRAAEPGGRRFYSTEQFTPDQIRQGEPVPWQQARIFHGGQWRDLRYKEVVPVYWRCGGAKRPLRLLVVAPVPYSSGKGKRKYYGQPLFCSPLTCIVPLPLCCKPTSIAGRSRSTTARSKIPSGSDKPSCAAADPSRANPPCWWPPTAPCSWLASRCSATHVRIPSPRCPNGVATLAAPLASIWLLSFARRPSPSLVHPLLAAASTARNWFWQPALEAHESRRSICLPLPSNRQRLPPSPTTPLLNCSGWSSETARSTATSACHRRSI